MDGSVIDHIQKLAETTIEDITMDDVQILITSTTNALIEGYITNKEFNDIKVKLDRLQTALHLAPTIKVVF